MCLFNSEILKYDYLDLEVNKRIVFFLIVRIQHPIFEGDDMETAIEELNEIRKTHKKEISKS